MAITDVFTVLDGKGRDYVRTGDIAKRRAPRSEANAERSRNAGVEFLEPYNCQIFESGRQGGQPPRRISG